MKFKSIIFVFIVLISYSCISSRYERKQRKFEKLIKEYPSLIDTTTIIDTVVIRDTFTLSIPAKVDSIEFDSLLQAYCSEVAKQPTSKADSNKVQIVRSKIYSKCSLTELLGIGEQTLTKGNDTIIIAYRGTKKGLELEIVSLKRNITITNTLVTPCTLKWYNYPEKVMGAFLLLLLVVYVLARVIFK